MMQYPKANNRGISLMSEIKTGIRFILPQKATGVQYSYILTSSPDKNTPDKEQIPSHNYTITLNT